jgi:hypothetical protein
MINSSGDLKIETLSFHLVELTIIKGGEWMGDVTSGGAPSKNPSSVGKSISPGKN